MEIVKKGFALSSLAVLLVLFMASCAGAPASGSSSGASRPAEKQIETNYSGGGKSTSLLTAMNQAKMDAVQKAVVALIGSSQEQANREKLQEVLYGTRNPNAYVDKKSMETTVKDKIGEEYIYEITIDVNIAAIESILKTHGIAGYGGASEESQYAAAAEAAAGGGAGAPVATEASSDDWGEASEEEQRKMRQFLDTMSFMVYFNEDSVADDRYVRSAVNMANEFLASSGKSVYDLSQVEKLKEDQRLAYEEETGQVQSVLQWLAQKLNADVYVEVAAEVTGQTEGSNYYGTANVLVKFYETSTGQLLASMPYNSPRAFSRTSEFEAVNNALQSSVYKVMPLAMEQATGIMGKSFLRGLKYEIIIQNTPDNRMMSSFRRRLNSRVKYLEVKSQSPEETRLEVYYIGRGWELEDEIYGVSEMVPGMEGLYQVMMRGRSITFNTGL